MQTADKYSALILAIVKENCNSVKSFSPKFKKGMQCLVWFLIGVRINRPFYLWLYSRYSFSWRYTQ